MQVPRSRTDGKHTSPRLHCVTGTEERTRSSTHDVRMNIIGCRLSGTVSDCWFVVLLNWNDCTAVTQQQLMTSGDVKCIITAGPPALSAGSGRAASDQRSTLILPRRPGPLTLCSPSLEGNGPAGSASHHPALLPHFTDDSSFHTFLVHFAGGFRHQWRPAGLQGEQKTFCSRPSAARTTMMAVICISRWTRVLATPQRCGCAH